MMAQVNAGRVRFVGRGEYNNSTQYYVFDLVSYNGNSYYAKADTIGHLPTDTTYWQLVAEKGNVGPTGLTGNGISSIEKTGTSGLVDTYTITYTNGNTKTFDVSNGNGIDRIEKTATVGNKDTYTIYFTNGSTTTYEVSNGEVTREELEEEVERLSMIYNAFPSTTGEVEEGSINGTAEVPFKEIGLKGNTSQNTTSGYNIFEPFQDGNITSTQTSSTSIATIQQTFNYTRTLTFNNGEITGNPGVGNGSYYIWKVTYNGLKPNTTYSICCDYEYKNLTGTTGNLIMFDSIVAAQTNETSKSGKIVTKFTTDENGTYNSANFINTAPSCYNENTTMRLYNIQLVEGSYTAQTMPDYEPYTGGNPAPNPDYPYPVNVVTGDNEVKVEGKNLFNKASNIVVNKYIGADGTIQNEALNWYQEDYISVNSSTDYIMSSNTSSTVRIALYDKDKNFISRSYSTGNVQVTTTASTKYVRLSGYNNINDNIQLEVGSTATPYEPYQSQTYPINLGSMELCKIGDYQDYIYKNNGNWYKYGAVGKWKIPNNVGGFNNENNWYYMGLSNFTNIITNFNEGYCNYLKLNLTNFASDTTLIGFSRLSNTHLLIRNTACLNQSDYRTWFANNDIYIYIPLATPTITEITDTTLIEQLDNLEKAYSYDTQTNISQTNQDKPFIISYEAILSLRNVLNS